MLEALACGCAVITRLRGWLFQRVVPGVLITDSQRQASLWLSRLVRNPGLPLRIAASGARYVQKQHGLQSICEQWTDLLAELVRR
jgi:glycosyltransferase involved in cell wall biosynthesis